MDGITTNAFHDNFSGYYPEAFVEGMSQFLDNVLMVSTPLMPNFHDAFKALQIAFACEESGKTGMPVNIQD